MDTVGMASEARTTRSAVVWLAAIRPRTLSLALVPVLVGSVIGWRLTGALQLLPALAAVLCAVLIQVGTNLHNDAADFLRGADTPERRGPKRATAEGWLTARQVLRGAFVAFASAFVLGGYLVWAGGWPILLIGLASLAAGWAYTGGPRPIAYTPLGELFVFLFFGLLAVAGSAWLQQAAPTAPVLLAGAAIGALAAAVLVVNNYRDLESDARVGKRTLAVHLGRPATRLVYIFLLLLPFLLALALPGGWAALGALPFALVLIVRLRDGTVGPNLNRLLGNTAQLQLLFGALLAVGLVAA